MADSKSSASTMQITSAPNGNNVIHQHKVVKYTNIYKDVVFGPVLNVVGAGLLLVAHTWFLYYLEGEYKKLDKDTIKIRDYVDSWLPVFFFSILFEILWSVHKRVPVYHPSDTVNSVSLGALMTTTRKMIAKSMGFFPYAYVWKHYAVTQHFANPSVLGWWLMFFGVEFCYYWVHRTGHTVHALWAMHGVHHSSEYYNFSTALRQSTFHGLVSWAYYIPLALFFPPPLFMLQNQFNPLYQFWIHTPLIRKLGPLEYILNTPSQHRVHHGRNYYCIDKNYGGTLCIFDRLFGTFQEELDEVPIVYGIVHPLNTFEPIESNVKAWRDIFHNMWEAPGLLNKLRVPYEIPGWIIGTSPAKKYPIPPFTTDSTQIYKPYLPAAVHIYVIIHVALSIIIQNLVLNRIAEDHPLQVFICGSFIIYTLYTAGMLSDRNRNALKLEVFRLFIAVPLAVSGVAIHNNVSWQVALSEVGVVVGGVVVVSLVWVLMYSASITAPLKEEEIGKTNFELAEKQQAHQYTLAKFPIPYLNSSKLE